MDPGFVFEVEEFRGFVVIQLGSSRYRLLQNTQNPINPLATISRYFHQRDWSFSRFPK